MAASILSSKKLRDSFPLLRARDATEFTSISRTAFWSGWRGTVRESADSEIHRLIPPPAPFSIDASSGSIFVIDSKDNLPIVRVLDSGGTAWGVIESNAFDCEVQKYYASLWEKQREADWRVVSLAVDSARGLLYAYVCVEFSEETASHYQNNPFTANALLRISLAKPRDRGVVIWKTEALTVQDNSDGDAEIWGEIHVETKTGIVFLVRRLELLAFSAGEQVLEKSPPTRLTLEKCIVSFPVHVQAQMSLEFSSAIIIGPSTIVLGVHNFDNPYPTYTFPLNFRCGDSDAAPTFVPLPLQNSLFTGITTERCFRVHLLSVPLWLLDAAAGAAPSEALASSGAYAHIPCVLVEQNENMDRYAPRFTLCELSSTGGGGGGGGRQYKLRQGLQGFLPSNAYLFSAAVLPTTCELLISARFEGENVPKRRVLLARSLRDILEPPTYGDNPLVSS